MGWLMLLLIAVLTGAGLWLGGFPRRLWTVAATALTLGAAGYAWFGSPGLAGHPVERGAERRQVPAELIALREAMFGRFGVTYGYTMASDAMVRAGNPQAAALAIQGGVRRYPGEAGLWTMLGYRIAENDRQVVTPAGRFAFDRAIELAPRHPGPPYFLHLALVEEALAHDRVEKLAEARTLLARAVALTPAEASYRQTLVANLAGLDALIARVEGMRAAPAPAPPAR